MNPGSPWPIAAGLRANGALRPGTACAASCEYYSVDSCLRLLDKRWGHF